MTTLQQWTQGLSDSELVTEFIHYYHRIEIRSCYNSNDYVHLVEIENELSNRGASPSIAFVTGGMNNAEKEPSKEK